MLCQLTVRAYLAILMDKIDLEDLIEKASDTNILSAIAAIIHGITDI